MIKVKFGCHDLHAIVGGTWGKSLLCNKPKPTEGVSVLKKYITEKGGTIATESTPQKIHIKIPAGKFPNDTIKEIPASGKNGLVKADYAKAIEKMPDDHRKLEYGDFSDMTKAVKSFIRRRVLFLKYGTRPVILNNYLLKGTTQEQASIALVQELLGGSLLKDGIRFENEYIIGNTDAAQRLLDGIKVVEDVKSVFSIPSHEKKRELGKEEAIYKTQILAYAWLSTSQAGVLHYCLVPTPPEIIKEEVFYCFKKSLAKLTGLKFGDVYELYPKDAIIENSYNLDEIINDESLFYSTVDDRITTKARLSVFFKTWRQTLINHDIERIPKEERLITYSSELTPEWIAHATKRLKRAQEYGNYIWDNLQNTITYLNKTDNYETEKRR